MEIEKNESSDESKEYGKRSKRACTEKNVNHREKNVTKEAVKSPIKSTKVKYVPINNIEEENEVVNH